MTATADQMHVGRTSLRNSINSEIRCSFPCTSLLRVSRNLNLGACFLEK